MLQLPSSRAEFAKRRFRIALLCAAVLCLSAAAITQTSSVKSLLGVGQSKPTAPATPAPSQPVAPAPAAPTAIPLPDVASRSEDLKRTLRGVTDQLPTQEQVDSAKTTLDERDEVLQARQKAVDELLAGTPSTLELREEENYWRAKQKETGDLRNQLLAWANAAQAGVQQLQAEQPVWNATLQQNESTPDLGPTLEVIKKSVSELQRVTKHAQDELRVIVNLQIRGASQDQLAIDALDRLQKAREYVDSRIFERDSLPLWQVEQRRQVGENKELFQTATNRLMGIRAFAVQTGGAIVCLGVFGTKPTGLAVEDSRKKYGLQDLPLNTKLHARLRDGQFVTGTIAEPPPHKGSAIPIQYRDTTTDRYIVALVNAQQVIGIARN